MARRNISDNDFERIKDVVTLIDVLSRYGNASSFRSIGRRGKLVGPCPIHHGIDRNQFHISNSGKTWYCFSNCSTGGGVLDFVAAMEGTDTSGAAELIAKWFRLRGARPSKIGKRHPRFLPVEE